MDSGIFLVCLLVLKLALDFSPLSGSHYASYMAYGFISLAAGGVMLFQHPHDFVGYFAAIIGTIFFTYGVYKRQIKRPVDSDSAESSQK